MSLRYAEPGRWSSTYQWVTARLGATALIGAGVGVLVWTALRSPQPTPGEAALLALFASAFNIWGGAQFAKIGKVDAKHARSAVRRLLTVGRSLNLATGELQDALLVEDSARVVECTQVLLNQVTSVQYHLADAINDWDDVHTEALREVFRSQERARRAQEGEPQHD